MKKIIIIALALLAFTGCSCGSCGKQQSQQRNESRYLPEGAVLLKEYCSNEVKNCDYKYWTKWKFENECFISYDMNRQDAVLAKVSCEEID
jgi:hypothetical protein